MKRSRGFSRIVKELNYPPVFLIPRSQFAMIEGEEHKEENDVSLTVWGLAAVDYPVITIHPWLTGLAKDNTIYHEIAHHLFPEKPHWWIDLFGEKMAGGGGRGTHADKLGFTLAALPPRSRLLKMARLRSAHLKRAYKIARDKHWRPIPHPDYKKRSPRS